MFLRIFLLAFVCLVCGLNAFAKDIYVSQRLGDDRNIGGKAENTGVLTGPVRTLKRALELAENGDRLHLDPSGGPYRESVTLFGRKHSGDTNNPFIIEGQGAILDGTEPLPQGIWQHFRDDVYRFQPTMQPIDVTFFHLLDHGTPLPKGTQPDNLEAGEWCLFNGSVYFRVEPKTSPMYGEHYDISYSARMSGITLLHVRNVRIHDLTVQGFQVDGISATNSAQNIVLDNVVSRANGRSGVAIGGASSLSAGYGTFAENRTTQVLSLPYSKSLLFDCDVPEDGITGQGNEADRILVVLDAEE